MPEIVERNGDEEPPNNKAREITETSFSFQASPGLERNNDDDDEIELQWAAIERLPTYTRIRTALFDFTDESEAKKKVRDVTKLGAIERRVFIDRLINNIEEDNRKMLKKLKQRIDKVGVKLPTVELRFSNLSVEAKVKLVHGKPLPTLWNSLKSSFSFLSKLPGCDSEQAKISILKDLSGVIKPSRMTLLLGPPGCGKTTLLLALAGKLKESSLKVRGEITYNGYKLDEFVPQKTSAYINQYDLHMSEMTVKETVDFSARCQGVGDKADIMVEVSRKEKEAGIIPETDIDTYMKATSAVGLKSSLKSDYMLKILGLDICADTIVGDAMRRGISGGQKKRLTTGEMITGPMKVLLMDEISTGLDSSTTFQIVSCLQQLVHMVECTMLVSLLQPAPEVFDLFDDIILMAEGKILYHGPREYVLEFFEDCGFRCPERKGIADFLQEVTSRKDQAQYWYNTDLPYSYVSVDQFVKNFKTCHLGQERDQELLNPASRTELQKNAIAFSEYSVRKRDLFKACMAREWLLMKRNSFLYIFKSAQIGVVALITMTVFLRTNLEITLVHANYLMGSLFYALVRVMTTGTAELGLTASRLPVFYRQRDFFLYPAWAYAIPSTIIRIPFAVLESFMWTALTYYVIGYSPEPERFFKQFLLLFSLYQATTSLFRFLASASKNPVAAVSFGMSSLLAMFLFSGFILPRPSLPSWLKWAFWISPLTYAEIGISINEFEAPRWNKASNSSTTIGEQTLINRGLNFDSYLYWISVAAIFGFSVLFDAGYTLALTYLKPPGSSTAIISYDKLSSLEEGEDHNKIRLNSMNHSSRPMVSADGGGDSGGMSLPFEPLAVTFQDVQYFVPTPKAMKDQGFAPERLQLLRDVTGSFRPGVLTALMGVSGAGKTTLMDVLSGRKTGGTIEGEIKIGGYPKVQKTYARISGYCEQNDIHSPNLTIEESVVYAAWLRLPPEVDSNMKAAFIKEALQTIELDEIKDTLVGIPGVSGVSTEQRKRLTIAVELVSNPSIIFMDEPTSGLDARAAAIVMRVVKNVVRTRRTIVCTIHQPSIDIFERFDELILMKRGGQIIYSGELGVHSSKLIEYFQAIPGVPKIKDNYNPATWMLDITAASVEDQLDVDYALLYKNSALHENQKKLVKDLSIPQSDTKDLHFPTQFPQNGWVQYKACLWKQHLSYWRSPQYNLVRILFMIFASLLFAVLFWQKGKKIHDQQDLFNIIGAIYILVNCVGINNSTSVLPFIIKERTVLYREKFAGMYSSWAYSLAQVTIEIPYIFFLTFLFVIITYPTIGLYGSAYKVFWYFYSMFCTLLYFNFLGMMVVAWTATDQVARVVASFCFTMLNLFSGYLIPKPGIPKWWVWAYWICPTSWSLKGFFASQYGDVHENIQVFDAPKEISVFLEDYFGYKHGDLAVVAVVLLAFPIVFASLFTYGIARLNFQKR
ncbi:drug-responsive transcription factor pdr3 [Ranunculus cassubicifolius]